MGILEVESPLANQKFQILIFHIFFPGLDLHEPDCATQKKWASAQTLPNSSNTSSYSHNNSRHGPPGTPTGETVSSLQKKKYR